MRVHIFVLMLAVSALCAAQQPADSEASPTKPITSPNKQEREKATSRQSGDLNSHKVNTATDRTKQTSDSEKATHVNSRPPSQWNQGASQNSSGEKIQPASRDEKNDEPVLKDEGSEFKLNKSINITKPNDSSQNVPIDYQIGTIANKPAYVTVVVDADKAPKNSADAKAVLGDAVPKTLHVSGTDRALISCPDGKVCVETQVIDGKEVCVKWKCAGQ